MKRRVVVTGMDVVTPIGVGLENYWKAVLSGVSGVHRITHFDVSGLPSQFSAYLGDDELVERMRSSLRLSIEEPRGVVFALTAARAAVDSAGGEEFLRGPRAGIFIGTSGERLDLRPLGEVAYQARGADGRVDPAQFARVYCRRFSEATLHRTLPQYVTARVAGEYGILGPGSTLQTACTSSAQAVGEAMRAIRRGQIDLALAGGSECIVSPIEFQLFCLLGVLSKQNDHPESASRPFDARRDGFVIGEGAGILLLESLDHAMKRGAPILAELAGYGTACDAYRITDEAPDGRGAILAMRRALADAGLGPENVDYINAHGTSTPMNDRVETAAVKAVFGPRAFDVPISSTKSMIGHTISAAGAIELATCVLALRDQIAPPTINYEVSDPECDLDYVPGRPRPQPIRAALSNSFGFGGHNDCLVAARL
jgi:3-oxoacyl-[acyl-carrier-protein] synthase II